MKSRFDATCLAAPSNGRSVFDTNGFNSQPQGLKCRDFLTISSTALPEGGPPEIANSFLINHRKNSIAVLAMILLY